jgi:prepilin-type N-terminal cleavage/methylation domain-containing protein
METRNYGFSLVELLVVAAILSIGLLAIAKLFSQGSWQESRAYYETQANFLLEQTLENLTSVTPLPFTTNTTIDNVDYSITCVSSNITLMESGTSTNCSNCSATCTVLWNVFGQNRSMSFTYAAR